MMRLYNTLTRSEEAFGPAVDGTVRMYTCGLTVYARGHIGNFRTFVCVDVLRRTLKHLLGYRMRHVMNFTDVDDRTIAGAQKAGMDLRSYTDQYIAAFREDAQALGLEEVEDTPRATDEVNLRAMADLVDALDRTGHTYRSDGSIYFKISTLPTYGQLARLDREGMKPGARIDSDNYAKEDARDFVLWKAAKEGEPTWDLVDPPGRPGWHLECSAMALRLLGEPPIDIHAGGIDLVFPHHENEIAQSESLTGKPFARFWLHAEFLMVEGQKMSKSLGNYFTLRDILGRGYAPEAVRYLLASVPHRKTLNFTFDGLQSAKTAIERLRNFKLRLETGAFAEGSNPALADRTAAAQSQFMAAMDDDLNTAEALAAMFEYVREINSAMDAGEIRAENRAPALEFLARFDAVFAVLQPTAESGQLGDAEVEALVQARNEAKKARNFALSDQLRQQLLEQGIILEDTKSGTRWKRKSS
jgi:cysteinyl-tRNA synthetase